MTVPEIKMAPWSAEKVTALMQIIHRMIRRYQRTHAPDCDEKVFELFECAKMVDNAKSDSDFHKALGRMEEID